MTAERGASGESGVIERNGSTVTCHHSTCRYASWGPMNFGHPTWAERFVIRHERFHGRLER